MATVSRLGYLAVGVDNLDEAIEFYTRFVRLEVSERRRGHAFLTGGYEHHWLRLEEGNGNGLKRVGYVVETEEELVEARAKLAAASVEYTEGGDPDNERVRHWLRFRDPGGTEIELYVGMFERGVAPMSSGVSMQKFLHAAWATGNFEETTAFYQQVLGFKVSDWVEQRAGFFRAADRYHHSLVLIRAERPVFNHFCIQVNSLDDVMRARHNALKGGVKLRDDLLRHAPSGSIGFYMKDETRGYAVEFCCGHPQLDDATHRPRVLQSSPETMNVWLAELPDHRAAAGVPEVDGEQVPGWSPGSEPALGGGRRLVGS
ncbi:VOC family protein [Streptomyces sp. NPDC001978]|uniref:VOC family protein n=1 Tax=Streptomyces sp. NPDC001978 TaxID=3364627 RepID=UPI0036928975